MTRTRFDVGQIIRDWSDDFYARHKVVSQVRKSFARMALCRTKALGGLSRVWRDTREL